jgi:hypothetical protein
MSATGESLPSTKGTQPMSERWKLHESVPDDLDKESHKDDRLHGVTHTQILSMDELHTVPQPTTLAV